MLIIGLGHKARHGKDTFADAVRAHYGNEMDIQLASFADPLRAEVKECAETLWAEYNPTTPFNGHEAMRLVCAHFGQPFEENPIVDEVYPWGKQRKLYQWYGTEFRRAQDPEYWTKRADDLVTTHREARTEALFFRDLRFGNEYDLIGGYPHAWRIKVSRLGYVSDVPPHRSETELDNHDFDMRLGVRDGELALLKELSVDMFRRILANYVVKRIKAA